MYPLQDFRIRSATPPPVCLLEMTATCSYLCCLYVFFLFDFGGQVQIDIYSFGYGLSRGYPIKDGSPANTSSRL